MSLGDIFEGVIGPSNGYPQYSLHDLRLRMLLGQLPSQAAFHQNYASTSKSENNKNEVDSNEKLLLLIED